jgi:hypothetical protein
MRLPHKISIRVCAAYWIGIVTRINRVRGYIMSILLCYLQNVHLQDIVKLSPYVNVSYLTCNDVSVNEDVIFGAAKSCIMIYYEVLTLGNRCRRIIVCYRRSINFGGW